MKFGEVVVFGGAGFIGTHLLEQLSRLDASRLISVDIRPPARAIPGVEYQIHDVRIGAIPDFGCSTPLVFNLSAVHTTPGHEPWEYYETNVTGSLNICKFARHTGARKIVFASSISVYGPDEVAKDETTPPTPTSDYGRSKLMAEAIHDLWLEEAHDRNLVIVRPAVVFGQGEGGNFTRLARLLKKGFFVFPGRKDTVKSCIYVKMLVDWIMYAIDLEERRIVFNGSYATRYTISDIVDTFMAVSFPNIRKFLLPAGALRLAAALFRPLSSATGLGIHPERIEKLMKSTNILPAWATAHGLTSDEDLALALKDWRDATQGRFD